MSKAKRPHDIDVMMERIADAVKDFAKAALFELAERGHETPFEQLVACIISIRTYDEVMLPVALKLFEHARTPKEMAKLSPEEIDQFIRASTFHEGKARQIHALSQRCVDEYDGVLPCDEEIMLSFHGVGPKCTNLVMGIACNTPKIGVDIHVHRITNRWGYVATKTPEKTMAALMEKLTKRYWVEINRVLVPFGKHICTGTMPKCSTCPVLEFCQQVGVERHR